jgi:hypothetical protein
MARDDMVDPIVRQKCKVLFAQWANAYSKTPGLERIANLYKEFPKTKRPAAAREKVLQDTSMAGPDDTHEPPPAETRTQSKPHAKAPTPGPASRPVSLTPTSSGFSHKLFKEKKPGHGSAGKPFSLSKEKDNMTNAIAKASIACTNLMNGLQLINRENERVSSNTEILRRVEACKSLRRKILYYIQHVESDEWIGSLVNANDELVNALTAYHIMDRSISDDSDSEWEAPPEQAQSPNKGVTSETQNQLAGLSLEQKAPPKPPRPASMTVPMPPKPVPAAAPSKTSDDEEEDEDDPFADSNAAQTPFHERPGMTWKEV